MNKAPISNPFDDDAAYTRNIRLAMLGCALFVCFAFSVIGLITYQTNIVSLYNLYFPTPTLTSTPQATPTRTSTPTPTATSSPTPNLTATHSAFQALAFQATASHAMHEWQTVITETFDDNSSGWRATTTDMEHAKFTYEIIDGTYRWNAVAHRGFIEWIPLPTTFMDNFFLSVEVRLGTHTGSNDYGIIFRRDTAGNFYYFAIDADYAYSLFKYYEGTWSTLIDRTFNSLIKKDEPNRLAVIAEGDHLILFINDQFLADEHDDSIKTGTAALAIEIFYANQEGIFEFDNIELRIP